MKIAAVYMFPTDPVQHLPRDGAFFVDRFTSFEKKCTRCALLYQSVADEIALAFTQVKYSVHRKGGKPTVVGFIIMVLEFGTRILCLVYVRKSA